MENQETEKPNPLGQHLVKISFKVPVNHSHENGLFSYEHIPNSSLIDRIIYSYGIWEGRRVSEKISVRFKDGGLREYISTDTDFKDFVEAESVGKYWHREYKGRRHEKRIK